MNYERYDRFFIIMEGKNESEKAIIKKHGNNSHRQT